ncbi:hypothetical protein IH574_03895 [Candidatus Bathyarchaeota archaeon]|nr:hypothetical protein [Candidatus Bathyarchaeota archaeon]
MLFTESFQYLLETGFQNWMTEALTKMNIDDVEVDYLPTDEKEPLVWEESSRRLIIHEPDPFHAAVIFLEWVTSELPRQWRRVWINLQQIEKTHGRSASEVVLQDYIIEMESRDFSFRFSAPKESI